ncbi:hypothetical protein EDB19DRAFT_1942797 [Suillus lakei]|nr:hypothetical protein EDB19DRAFT_1942797 [Suillus lakei]
MNLESRDREANRWDILRSFEQSYEGVDPVLAKNGILETFDLKRMISADGAKESMNSCPNPVLNHLQIRKREVNIRMVNKFSEESSVRCARVERLSVISEMLEVTTSILNQAIMTRRIDRTKQPHSFHARHQLPISSIVLDEFATPVEGKPINAYGVLDEKHLEVRGGAPDAPNMLQALISYGAYATPISASVMPVAPPADLVLVDQEGYTYSAYLMEAGRMKAFVIRRDGVIGAIVHGAEGMYF